MTDLARWAILGAGGIALDFLTGLPESRTGRLHAVAARDASRARAFADAHGAPVAGTYADVLARDDVDAVYVATVHPAHADLVHAALDAGKAVLCEKPLTVTPADTDALLAHAAAAGLPLVEAFKYRFGPFADRVREVVAEDLGELQSIEASFGFAAGARTGRLFDPATAGGAIFDVGCYPVSYAVGLAAVAGRDLTASSVVEATGLRGDTGVDETASVTLDLDGSRAVLHTSIVEDQTSAARVTGARGVLEIPDVWGSRSESPAKATLRRADGTTTQIVTPVVQPMAAEADAVIDALRAGRTEAPEMSWAESAVIARLLDDWLAGF